MKDKKQRTQRDLTRGSIYISELLRHVEKLSETEIKNAIISTRPIAHISLEWVEDE